MSHFPPAFIPGGFASHKRGKLLPTVHGQSGGKGFNGDFVRNRNDIYALRVKTGLTLWVRSPDFSANSLSTPQVGDHVSSWIDKSGLANNMALVGTAPVLVSGRAGFPLVDFTGSQVLEAAANPLLDTDSMTAFIVCRTTDTGNIFSRGSGNGFPSPGFSLSASPAGWAVVSGGVQTNCGFTYTTPDAESADGFNWYGFSRDVADSGRMKFYSAGNLRANVVGNNGAMRNSPDTILLCNGTAGRLGELIIYNRLLSDADRLLVDSYLRNRWLLR